MSGGCVHALCNLKIGTDFLDSKIANTISRLNIFTNCVETAGDIESTKVLTSLNKYIKMKQAVI